MKATYALASLVVALGCSASSEHPRASLDPLPTSSGGANGSGGGSAGGSVGAAGVGPAAGGGPIGDATCDGHTDNVLRIGGNFKLDTSGHPGTWSMIGEGWETGFRLSYEGSTFADVEVTARPMNGIVTAGTYDTDAPSNADALHLGLDVGCGVVGTIAIAGIAWDGNRVNEVSATFLGHCQGGAPVAGCFHYVRDGYSGGTPAPVGGFPPKAGVGVVQPCLTGGNVAYLFGDDADYIHPGPDVVTDGKWSAALTQNEGYANIHVDPAGAQHGGWWDLDFSTAQLGKPLAPGVYENAERAPFASPSHPGIDVGGDGRGCNTIGGRFQIHDVAFAGAALTSFTASFEQHCENQSTSLRGCVHYETK